LQQNDQHFPPPMYYKTNYLERNEARIISSYLYSHVINLPLSTLIVKE
jgi:hypothetical protein